MSTTAKERPVPGTHGKKEGGKRIALVLVRGLIDSSYACRETLRMLNLQRKNHCVVLEKSPTVLGMVNKVKDLITWGEISDETFAALVKKRGQEYLGRTTDSKNKYHYHYLQIEGKKYQRCFKLNPPAKGFGRKGIKIAFAAGGALGYRGEKMNDLIMRMI